MQHTRHRICEEDGVCKDPMGMFYEYLHDPSHMTEEYEVISYDDLWFAIEYWEQNTKEQEKISLHLSNKTF